MLYYGKNYATEEKCMQDLLCPHWVFDDYSSVTPEFLQRLGVRLLLSDLDFTLAPKKQRTRMRRFAHGSKA